MPKRKSLQKKRQTTCRKIPVKKKFADAIKRLKRMKTSNQRAAALGASNEFIRDVSAFMSKLRKQPDLVKGSHRNVLKRHSLKLRKLIHAKTPLEKKRMILSQTGGILPALIPIIVAIIGAGGGIASAATSAAIIKS